MTSFILPAKSKMSLQDFFKYESARWTIFGFIFVIFLTIPTVLYFAKIESERHLLLVARSVSHVYRPMILQDDIRDAEFQIQDILSLKNTESVVIRDASFKAIYPLKDKDKVSRCGVSKEVCWGKNFNTMSVLYPIYFNTPEKGPLYGYLELTLESSFDLTFLSLVLVLIAVVFLIQAAGLYSALQKSYKLLLAQTVKWASHLRNPSKAMASSVPFTELQPMQEAIDSLHNEIELLKEQTTKEAKDQAQFSMLREISHDLKTPLALVAKNFEILMTIVAQTGKVDQTQVDSLLRNLKQTRSLLKQVCAFKSYSSNPEETCDLIEETSQIFQDFKNHPEILEKNISLRLMAPELLAKAKVSPLAYFRVLENLVSNAVEASDPNAEIQIELKSVENRPVLSVKDNGAGIPIEVQKRVFDLDFTTKLNRGTGLGLGIVAKICKEYGANLELRSSIGVGSEFLVSWIPSVGHLEEVSDV